MVAVVEKPGLSSTVGRCNRNFTHISSEEFVSKIARPKIHCWLVVWKCLEHFLLFDSVGNFMIPTDEVTKSYFFRGLQSTNQTGLSWFIIIFPILCLTLETTQLLQAKFCLQNLALLQSQKSNAYGPVTFGVPICGAFAWENGISKWRMFPVHFVEARLLYGNMHGILSE